MGQEDANIQAFVWSWIVPALLCYATYKMFGKGFLTKSYQWTYARRMSRLAKTLDRVYDERKMHLFEDLHNMSDKAKPRALNILEVAVGAGTNFKYFPDGCNVICVDPNPYFESYIKSQQKLSSRVNVTEFVVGKCEDLNLLPDERLDAVVCTLGLCSVGDVRESLKEIRRVLKPGGKLFFMEHVKAGQKSWFLRNLQRLVYRPWRLISNGCNLLSETLSHIEAAGFSEVSADQFSARMPFLLTPMRPTLVGTAVK